MHAHNQANSSNESQINSETTVVDIVCIDTRNRLEQNLLISDRTVSAMKRIVIDSLKFHGVCIVRDLEAPWSSREILIRYVELYSNLTY